MAEGFLKSFDNNLEVFSAGTKPRKDKSICRKSDAGNWNRY